ncbi:hypothetical protein BC828DRAFT_255721 [Blastocladiella britannica]|nr:hypothetical protein BC828DRAFT_255721 [Blastocladiella britannica]
MQVSGRWTERCAKPSMGAGAIIIICCIGFVVVFLSFYFVPAMVHNVQESLKRAANRRRRERQQMHNDSGAVLVPPGEAPPAYVGENGGRGRRNRSPAAAAAAAAAPMTSDDWRFASSSDAPHARVDAISGRRVWFTGPAEGAATTSVAEGASAASFAGATTAPGNSGPIGSVMTMYPIKKPVAGQEQQKAMQYFEVTVSQREQRSTTRVGLARKPHLANAHPGSVTGSIGLDLSTGTVYVNGRQHGKAEVPVSKPGSGDLGEDPLLPAVIVGVGVDATTDQAFFTVNGTLAWKERGKAEVVEQSTGGNRHAGRGRWNVFPTVGGSGKFVVDANFGDEDPFAWDHANTAAGGIIDVGLPSYVM